MYLLLARNAPGYVPPVPFRRRWLPGTVAGEDLRAVLNLRAVSVAANTGVSENVLASDTCVLSNKWKIAEPERHVPTCTKY